MDKLLFFTIIYLYVVCETILMRKIETEFYSDIWNSVRNFMFWSSFFSFLFSKALVCFHNIETNMIYSLILIDRRHCLMRIKNFWKKIGRIWKYEWLHDINRVHILFWFCHTLLTNDDQFSLKAQKLLKYYGINLLFHLFSNLFVTVSELLKYWVL